MIFKKTPAILVLFVRTYNLIIGRVLLTEIIGGENKESRKFLLMIVVVNTWFLPALALPPELSSIYLFLGMGYLFIRDHYASASYIKRKYKQDYNINEKIIRPSNYDISRENSEYDGDSFNAGDTYLRRYFRDQDDNCYEFFAIYSAFEAPVCTLTLVDHT